MTDLNKEREVNLRFEQDDGAVWVFADDSQFGTEISHLMMMHADEYNEDEIRRFLPRKVRTFQLQEAQRLVD